MTLSPAYLQHPYKHQVRNPTVVDADFLNYRRHHINQGLVKAHTRFCLCPLHIYVDVTKLYEMSGSLWSEYT